jgi:toxin CptA
VDIVLASVAFMVAMLAAATMGFAIQRGATCTVAAVEEVVARHTCRRLIALVEASIWVAGGLLLVDALHLSPPIAPGHALTAATVAGGVLLGVGAYINGACVFGAIARFGSGDASYIATPIGIYAGSLVVTTGFVPVAAALPSADSPVLALGMWLAVPFAAYVLWRIAAPLARLAAARSRGRLAECRLRVLAARVWQPHAATLVIGIAFVVLLVLVGAWDYTTVLAEVARGMSRALAAKLLLLGALFAGAVLGGHAAGRFARMRISSRRLARCFCGGTMMGAGGLIVPGHNDGLILIGMPLLRPYAWAAFVAMCASIAVAIALERALDRRMPRSLRDATRPPAPM